MTLTAEVRPCRHQHGRSFLEAFAEGFARHGGKTSAAGADFTVMWGHKDRAVLEAGKPYLVLEQGYLGNRLRWTSMGWNGLNGRATFPIGDVTRWERYFADLMRPWRSGVGVALLAGQVPGDAALGGVDINAWARNTVAELIARGWHVVYRPHPKAPHMPCPAGAEFSRGSLEGGLMRAALCVTYSSNAGVEAILAGVPTVAMDKGSMAWPVTMHEIPEAELFRPERDTWAHGLAWCQWTLPEIASGEAWEHVRKCH